MYQQGKDKKTHHEAATSMVTGVAAAKTVVHAECRGRSASLHVASRRSGRSMAPWRNRPNRPNRPLIRQPIGESKYTTNGFAKDGRDGDGGEKADVASARLTAA